MAVEEAETPESIADVGGENRFPTHHLWAWGRVGYNAPAIESRCVAESAAKSKKYLQASGKESSTFPL